MRRSNKSSRRPKANPAIEPLENRLYRSADLTGVFAGATPTVLNPADRNRAAIEIENSGDSLAAGVVTVDLYAATGSTPDDAGVLLATATRHVKLKPGAQSGVKFRFSEPSDLPDGSYSLLARIDASAISNAIETNDIVGAQSPVRASQPFVDLTAENVQGPIKPIFIENNIVVGGTASVTIQNRGTQAAKGTATIDFYLSPDSTFDSNAFLAGETPARPINLQPGRSEKFKAVLEPPSTTAADDYFLFAVLTPGGGIVQKNSADEVGKSAHQVVVVEYGNRPTPPPPVTDVTDAGSTEIAPGFVVTSVPCSSGDSSCDNSTPPCTSPTTCPTTAPATNCDPPSANSQPCDNGNSDQPAQDSCDSNSTDASDASDTSADPSTSCDPQQPQPVDADAANPGAGQSADSTSADAGDTSSQPSTDGGRQDASSDNSSDNSGQPDNSQPAPDNNESDGSDDQSSQADASSVDDSGGGGDDSYYIDDSGD
jgi:hypothetical protein